MATRSATPKGAVKAKKSASAPKTQRVKPGTNKQAAAERMKLFVEAMIATNGNRRESAIRAGLSQKTAGAQATRLMKNPVVQEMLRVRQAALSEKYQLSTERTLLEIARIAYADPRRFFNEDGSLKGIGELDDDTAATLASVEIEQNFEGRGVDRQLIGFTKKIKVWDKNAALEKAMKFHGLYELDNRQKGEGLAALLAQLEK
ncbi:terminase small subunit [mine drainage metagenome]|uniref:Terminase small subunit n=1 Tax=mine drainage metagenome TaxID=410659 RepID=A0A1J5S2I0_9ZZZZ